MRQISKKQQSKNLTLAKIKKSLIDGHNVVVIDVLRKVSSFKKLSSNEQ